MKIKVLLPLIAMMIFLLTSTCIVKEVKAEELYTIAEGTLGTPSVWYTIKIPRECKLGDIIPVVFEFHMNRDEEISYFHFYGGAPIDFDEEYTDISGITLLTETFEVKLSEGELPIEFKYHYLSKSGEFYGWQAMRVFIYSIYESQINALQSQINELNNELNNLKTTNTQLSSQLSDLQKRYDSLERDYKGLERDYESLQKAPRPFIPRELQYLLIMTTVILTITTIYFAARKRA